VIMAGGHHFMNTPIGDALIAYALPDKWHGFLTNVSIPLL
jgi:hypothetical protein